MRRLVPEVTCDVCSTALSPDTPSVRLSLALPSSVTLAYAGELCDECSERLEDRVSTAADTFLRVDDSPPPRNAKKKVQKKVSPYVADPTPRTTGSSTRQFKHDPTIDPTLRTCPLCGHIGSTRGALGQHLYAIHNSGFRQLGLALPSTPPSRELVST